MIKKFSKKIFMLKLLYFIVLISFSYSEDFNNQDVIKMKAYKEGYDLTNPNDNFFLDICLPYSYKGKDVTLEYRQKYFYFPNNKEKKNYHFLSPIRNNTYSCFQQHFQFKYIYKNMALLVQVPLFIFELIMLIITIYLNPNQIFINTPLKKIDLINRGKCFLYKADIKPKQSNFSKFHGENNSETASNQKIDETINNTDNIKEQEDNSDVFFNLDNNQNMNQNNDDKERRNSQDSKNIINNDDKDNIDDENNKKEKNKEDKNINGFLKEDDIENNLNIDDALNNGSDDIIKSQQNISKEKSIDNYTFGINVNIKTNFNNIEEDKSINSKNSNKNQQKPEDTLKRVSQIYKRFNNENNFDNKLAINNIIHKPDNNPKTAKNDTTYSREEFYYFGYPLAILRDGRNILQMYFDLLNHCQIIFKFCLIPFNIYEDRKLQYLYYSFKINLHLLFNFVLTTNSEINDIYDEKNNFNYEIKRCLLSCIFTYVIGLFIYNLINIKKTLIKRRNQLINLRITDHRINEEIYRRTTSLCMDYYINKLYILLLFLVLVSTFSIYICFSFCIVYKNTQKYVLKCVILSCLFSQISPFILCIIPSFLRKLSITKKKIRLYYFAKLVESLFLP